MKTILGIMGLMVGGAIGGFWNALLLCTLGIFIGHFITTHKRDDDPWYKAEQSGNAHIQTEDIPDLSTHAQLRAYIAQLTARLQTLEQEVSLLKRGATVAPAPQPDIPQHSPAAPLTQPLAPQPEPIQESPVPDMPQEHALPPPSLETASGVEPEAASVVESTPESVAVSSPKTWWPAEEHVPAPSSEEPAPIAADTVTAPSLFSRLVSGNIVAKVGVVILFFGVGFLLKFAYDYGLLPPEVRLIGVAIAAALLFRFGWTILETRRLYGLILQGGASGLAYIDIFFALKTYGFISPAAGFGLFVALGVATTVLAVRQDAKPLAVFGLMGAFLAPILASTGSGNHVLLFSYYTLLSIFILGVSWFKSWRELNLTGWAFTFPIGLFWGWSHYQPELFATVEPFVLIFFGIYLIIPILFATRQPPELKGFVDGTLVFGTPAATAFMQSGLVEGLPYGLAWSAAVASALYGILAILVIRRENMRLLGETYCALSVGLGTLAIFFAFGAYTTFALWTIEGAAILWVGLRQGTTLARLFGLLVQIAGALYFFIDYGRYDRSSPLFNDAVLGCAIIAGASIISAVLMRREADRISENERVLGNAMLLWGAVWWSLGGLDAIHHGVSHMTQAAVAILFFSATFAATERVGAGSGWTMLRGLSSVHPLVLACAAFAQFTTGVAHPLADNGWLAWPAGLGILFWTLHRQRRDGFDLAADARDGGGWLILISIATWEAGWLFQEKHYLYCMLLAAVGAVTGYLRFHLRERDQTDTLALGNLLLLWATAFWFAAGLGWIHEQWPDARAIGVTILFFSATFALTEHVGVRSSWIALRCLSAVHPIVLMLAALAQASTGVAHPLADNGWLAWPTGLGVLFWTLHRQRHDSFDVGTDIRTAAGWVVLIGIATWEAEWLLVEKRYVQCLLLALSGYLAGYLRFHLRERGKADVLTISNVLLTWATVFWFMAGLGWIHENVSDTRAIVIALAFVGASSLLYELAAGWLTWPALRWPALTLWIAMPLAAGLQVLQATHPLGNEGWAAWPFAWACAMYGLYHEEREGRQVLSTPRHAMGLWLPIALATWELHYWTETWNLGHAWRTAVLALPSTAVLIAALHPCHRNRWPLETRWPLYRDFLLTPVACAIGLWTLVANLKEPGSMSPISYLPLLNPLDLMIAAAFFALATWRRSIKDRGTTAFLDKVLAVSGFIWLNAIAFRSIHYWADVPYRLDRLLDDMLVQATLSILWTSTALVLMVVARRRMKRQLWLIGAGLLGIVVTKLFLVDLANSGTIARIVSFLVVGVLLLVIGYVAPVPPGEQEADAKRS